MLALCEAYEDSDNLYSLTEPCHQLPVSTQEAGALLEETVAEWGHQIVLALAHCHQQGESFMLHAGTGLQCTCLFANSDLLRSAVCCRRCTLSAQP